MLKIVIKKLGLFPRNCENVNEEQEKYFHQGIQVIENCIQGHWDGNFPVDYC